MQVKMNSVSQRGHSAITTLSVARYVKPRGAFVLLGILLVLTLMMLANNGIFNISGTFSDEHDHFKRSMMFSAIVRGNLSLEAIGTFYSGGIWPPFYPMLIGGFQAATHADVGALRIINVLLAYAGFALLIAAVAAAWVRYAIVGIAGLFSLGTHYYYQIRPENLIILLLAALIYLVVKRGLFSAIAPAPRGRLYALGGTLCALSCLTHAFLAIVAVYLLVLGLMVIRQRMWFIIAFVAIAGPYVIAQKLIHNGVVLFATTAEENLARNNNVFLRNNERPKADDLLFDEMERRYKAGDKEVYPRPLVLPQTRYEQWLHDENKRRIFKEMAISEVSADPAGAAIRALGRATALVSGEGCIVGQRYGCNVSPGIDRFAFYGLELLALVGLLCAAKNERWYSASFSFVFACFAMLTPMIATQAVERQFIIVLLLAAFGGLARLRPL